MKISKYYILPFFCFSLLSCADQKVTAYINSNLHIIEMRVKKDPTLNLSEVEPAIIILEDITGIQSESDGDYIGRYKPTLNDYKRWSDWLKKNRDRLYWDDKNKTVIVK